MSKTVEFDDFMSESDTAIWVGERDPRLRSTIVSVWILDQMPDEDDFEEMLAESVEAIPRLRQRVVRDWACATCCAGTGRPPRTTHQ